MNRERLKSLLSGILLAALLATTGVYAAEPNLVEGAKKEGKLVAYVSMLTENATSLLAEFKKKYPFIETSLYRANTQKLLPKIQLEARTQQHEADVISATFTIWNELTRGKLVMKYDSPERAKYPDSLKDPEGYWNILHLGVQGMAYNTKLVSPEIAPKRYEDLLQPRWRPKQIAMDFRDSSWMAVMLEIMGEQEGAGVHEEACREGSLHAGEQESADSIARRRRVPNPGQYLSGHLHENSKSRRAHRVGGGKKPDPGFYSLARYLRARSPPQRRKTLC